IGEEHTLDRDPLALAIEDAPALHERVLRFVVDGILDGQRMDRLLLPRRKSHESHEFAIELELMLLECVCEFRVAEDRASHERHRPTLAAPAASEADERIDGRLGADGTPCNHCFAICV